MTVSWKVEVVYWDTESGGSAMLNRKDLHLGGGKLPMGCLSKPSLSAVLEKQLLVRQVFSQSRNLLWRWFNYLGTVVSSNSIYLFNLHNLEDSIFVNLKSNNNKYLKNEGQ